MDRKIRVCQYGCGKMSKYTMQYAYDHGCEVVSAFDVNPEVIGKDIGTIMESEKRGVFIMDASKASEYLKENKPDVCIVTTMSLLNDLENILLICASNGINVITTCEEAFFAANSNPNLYNKINDLAKMNKCTIIGTGYQDIYWGELISAIASSANKIKEIRGSSSYNVEEYGIALANAHGAGLTLEEFDKNVAASDNISDEERNKLINEGTFLPSYMWNVNGWLASKLNLTVTSQRQKCIPTTYEDDLASSTLGMVIPKGNATGMSAVVTTETAEGITIVSECIGKVYSPTDFDKNEWSVIGEPSTTIVVNRPSTVELTCATVINRIPDVINNTDYGFVSSDKLDELKYRTKNLNEYIK